MTSTTASNPIDLGDGHVLTLVDWMGEVAACRIAHKRKDGTQCDEWVPFAGRSWARSFEPKQIAAWNVVSDSPLTLSPSIECRVCGDHGFVRGGKWVRA